MAPWGKAMGNTSPLGPTVDETAAWIRSYLDEYPKAADTAAGIQRWWLAPRQGEVALLTVELALAKLESEGAVKNSDPMAVNPTYGRQG